MIDNDLALSDLIDRVEAKVEKCKRCGGEGVVADKTMTDPCPQCGDERCLMNVIAVLIKAVTTVEVFDQYACAALSGLAETITGDYTAEEAVDVAFECAFAAVKKRQDKSFGKDHPILNSP